MSTFRRRIGTGPSALVALVAISVASELSLSQDAHAQACPQNCANDLKDANGCCTAASPTPAPHRAPAVAPPPASCSDGREVNPDTAGHCCWPGQVWAGGKCVGVPSSCPAERTLNSDKQDCVLPACTDGQLRTDDRVHCCWAGQGWSRTRAQCVGVPTCPTGLEVEGGDHCVSKDKDNDGIPNSRDQCPDQPEDINNYRDDDGCPDEPERLAVLRKLQQEQAERDRAAADAAAQARAAEQQRQEEERERLAKQQREERDAREAEARRKEAERQAAEEERDARAGRMRNGIIIGGAGVGFGVVSLVFMAKGSSENSTIRNGGLPNAAAIQSADSSGSTANTIAVVTGVLGLAGIAIGTPLVLFNLPKSDDKPAQAGRVYLTPTPGGFALSGAF